MQTPKYNAVADTYNQTRRADPYLLGRVIHHLAPRPGGTYLDIGCGTGNYTIALQQHGLRMMGVEPSEEMLGRARARNSEVDWRSGRAEAIPLSNSAVDGIVATLTLHHWADVPAGCKELARVVRPGGRLVILTSTPEQMDTYWLHEYFPKMLADSTALMPTLETIAAHLDAAGFDVVETEKYFVQDDLQDQFLQVGKRKPHLYFDPEIRKGISSFSFVSNAEEVARGLELLKQDIETGAINRIIADYDSDAGDYLFIVAERK